MGGFMKLVKQTRFWVSIAIFVALFASAFVIKSFAWNAGAWDSSGYWTNGGYNPCPANASCVISSPLIFGAGGSITSTNYYYDSIVNYNFPFFSLTAYPSYKGFLYVDLIQFLNDSQTCGVDEAIQWYQNNIGFQSQLIPIFELPPVCTITKPIIFPNTLWGASLVGKGINSSFILVNAPMTTAIIWDGQQQSEFGGFTLLDIGNYVSDTDILANVNISKIHDILIFGSSSTLKGFALSATTTDNDAGADIIERVWSNMSQIAYYFSATSGYTGGEVTSIRDCTSSDGAVFYGNDLTRYEVDHLHMENYAGIQGFWITNVTTASTFDHLEITANFISITSSSNLKFSNGIVHNQQWNAMPFYIDNASNNIIFDDMEKLSFINNSSIPVMIYNTNLSNISATGPYLLFNSTGVYGTSQTTSSIGIYNNNTGQYNMGHTIDYGQKQLTNGCATVSLQYPFSTNHYSCSFKYLTFNTAIGIPTFTYTTNAFTVCSRSSTGVINTTDANTFTGTCSGY
jgi:hypothetical protein